MCSASTRGGVPCIFFYRTASLVRMPRPIATNTSSIPSWQWLDGENWFLPLRTDDLCRMTVRTQARASSGRRMTLCLKKPERGSSSAGGTKMGAHVYGRPILFLIIASLCIASTWEPGQAPLRGTTSPPKLSRGG